MKTGSARDVAAVSEHVLAASGRRLILLAVINHPNVNAARPALDALTDWVGNNAPPGTRAVNRQNCIFPND